LLEKLLLLRLLLLWLEELLLRLGRLEGRLLLRLEMSWKGINLTILIIISGETLQSNLFSSQLRKRNLLRLVWGKLLLLLRSKLLWLLGKLLLLLRSKLLRLLGKLLGLLSKLLLGSKLLLLLRSKLLLLSGHKLLSRLWLLGSKLLRVLSKLLVLVELSTELAWLLLSKLLRLLLSKLLRLLLGKLLWLLLSKLLSLLEISEVLVEVLSVELLGSRSVGVKVCSIEHWSSGSLSVVGEGLSLGRGIILLSNQLLLLNDSLLESKNSSMSLFLQLKSRISLLNRSSTFWSLWNWNLEVGLESSAVISRVLHNLDFSILIHDSILSLHISLSILGF